MLNDDINTLSANISFYAKEEKERFSSHSISTSEDINWSAAQFYTSVLCNCRPNGFYFIDYARLQELQEVYNTKTSEKVNVDELLKKGWLRLVYDLVHIPVVIRKGSSEVDKLVGLNGSFGFILSIRKTKLDKIKFYEEVNKYENLNEIKVDLEPAFNHSLIKENNGIIEVGNVDFYLPIWENLNNFKFIKYLYECLHLDGEKNKLVIDNEILFQLIKKHKILFPDTPRIENLIANKKIKSLETSYEVFFHRQHDNEPIFDKIAAILWEKLLRDSSFPDDKSRLRFWYLRVVHKSLMWCNVGKYCVGDSLIRFVNVSRDIILAEQDLENGQSEYSKMKLDRLHGDLWQLNSTFLEKDHILFPEDNEPFLLYSNLRGLSDAVNDDLIYYQSARVPLVFFIRQIIKIDSKINLNRNYPLIKSLLLGTSHKPYLIWEVCKEITEHKPEIIPFLFLENELTSLAFELLGEIEIEENILESNDDIRTLMAKKGLTAVLIHLTGNNLSSQLIAKVIFQYLIGTWNKKFKKQERRSPRIPYDSVILANELMNIMSATFLPGNVINSFGTFKELLFPSILPDLFEQIKVYSNIDYYRNHTLCLPFVKLDFLSALLKLCGSKDFKEQTHLQSDLEYQISAEFTTLYVSILGAQEMDGWDYFSYEAKKKLPTWHDFPSFNEKINWQEVLLVLEKYNLSDEFIAPQGIEIVKKWNSYEDTKFAIEKIRTHLAILLSCFNRLVSDQWNF